MLKTQLHCFTYILAGHTDASVLVFKNVHWNKEDHVVEPSL